MKPLWDPEEAKSDLYQDVEQHSDGMISFTYRPPSASDLDALKGTRTYQNWLREHPAGAITSTDKPVTEG